MIINKTGITEHSIDCIMKEKRSHINIIYLIFPNSKDYLPDVNVEKG